MRIRETEGLKVSILEDIENHLKIVDLQGLLIGGTNSDLENCVDNKIYDVELTCVEAVQLDETERFGIAFDNSFSPEQWNYKLEFSKVLNANLYLIVYKKEFYYICLIGYNDNSIPEIIKIDYLEQDKFIEL